MVYLLDLRDEGSWQFFNIFFSNVFSEGFNFSSSDSFIDIIGSAVMGEGVLFSGEARDEVMIFEWDDFAFRAIKVSE